MRSLRCILLVDDDPAARYLHRRLLVQLGLGAHVLETDNGQQAQHLVRAQCADDFRTCPDLILLDIHMPVMDGLEFLVAYRDLPEELKGAQVVPMLTTPLHMRDLKRAAPLSVSAYLNKPLKAETLRALVQTHFAAPTPFN